MKILFDFFLHIEFELESTGYRIAPDPVFFVFFRNLQVFWHKSLNIEFF